MDGSNTTTTIAPSDLCYLFYCVNPSTHVFRTVEEVPPFISKAIPWFTFLLAIEIIVSFCLGRLEHDFRIKEVLCSLHIGMCSEIIGKSGPAVGVYLYAYQCRLMDFARIAATACARPPAHPPLRFSSPLLTSCLA